MRLMLKCIFLTLLAIPAFALQAGESLTPFKIENQFGEPAELTAETELVVFSSDMDAAKLVTKHLNDNAGKITLDKTLIVSDISKMPSMISKMFAIPKMKKYSFKMALDKTGDTTKGWPREKGTVVVMKLSSLKVDSVEMLKTQEDVAKIFTK